MSEKRTRKSYAKAEPSASRLLDEIRAMQKPSRRTWVGDLLPEVRAELEAVKEACRSGGLKHLPLRLISQRCIEILGLDVSPHTVERFLKGG